MPKPSVTKQGGSQGQKQVTQFLNSTEEDDVPQPRWAREMEQKILGTLEGLSQRVKNTEEDVEKVRERTVDLEFHMRKYNILIFGLDMSGHCEDKVVGLFRDVLEIKEPMLLAACHPIPGRRDGGKDRACIVRFVRLQDKDLVLKSCTKLKNTKISIMTDLPQEARAKRAELRQNAWNLRKSGLFVRVKERGLNIYLEEKKNGKWVKRE